MNINIIGLGCDLLGDSGIGVHAARKLSKFDLGENVNTNIVGNAILDNIDYFFNANLVIIIDAANCDKEPGYIYKSYIKNNDKEKFIKTKHGFDLNSLMILSGSKTIPDFIIYGIQTEHSNWTMSISDPARNSFAILFEQIKDDISQYVKNYSKINH